MAVNVSEVGKKRMKEKVRLDKYLADMGVGTRSEVKQYIRKGRITINGSVVKKPEDKVLLNEDEVQFDGTIISYQSMEYFMLNKPAGVVSATTDERFQTVVELIYESKRKDLFPVGRLDKDTEGLLLLTNDGDLAHRLLSPKKHVDKTYEALVKGEVTNEDIIAFGKGLVVDDTFTALPARLIIKQAKTERYEEQEVIQFLKDRNVSIPMQETISQIQLTIHEGKFHQVKRMFQAVGKEVVYLKRCSMGTLQLDKKLGLGEYRTLTQEEIKELYQC